VLSKPSTCNGCPAKEWGVGWVPPVGPFGPDHVWIGQGPGEQEANTGVPFHPQAPAGWRLTHWMNRCGLPRTRALITNVVWCWLPKIKTKTGFSKESRPPTGAECLWCWNAHLGPLMQTVDPSVPVFTVGAPATKWILGLPWDSGAERHVGTPNMVVLPPIGTNDG
jgi:uracil-DNA glycosylase family 4